jgi:hypothetical protein
MKMSRFVPLVKSHVESICAQRMTLDAFPFAKPPPPNSGLGGSPIENDMSSSSAAHRVTQIDRSLSVRKHSSAPGGNHPAGSAASTHTAESTIANPKEDVVFQGGRIIVFIAGGVTYSEIRALGEVMKMTKRECILGGTHFIRSGADFVKDMERLADDDAARRYLDDETAMVLPPLFDEEEDMERSQLLDNLLIDGTQAVMTEEEQAEEVRKAEDELNKKAELGIIPTVMGYVPFCGLKLQRWFNGDDDVDPNADEEDEDEDDGILGDLKGCFAGCCGGKKTKTQTPLAKQGQAV